MRRYYTDFFPYEWVEWFLTCGKKFPLSGREFAFRWSPDITKRNEIFNTAQDAQLYMDINGYQEDEVATTRSIPLRFGNTESLRRFLIAKQPHSIDIGPIYQSLKHVGSDRHDPYAPKLCALTFDIDLKDYNDPCQCHKDKRICDPCWIRYLRPALIDLVGFLRNVMEFQCIIPIFSAGAGFHVFVLDPDVWEWDTVARQALVKHLPASIKCDAAVVLNHLIKLPFSPHKANGYLSLPILDIETFLPSEWRIKIESVTEELIHKLVI